MVHKDGHNILTLNYKQNFFSISFKTNDYINGNNYSYYYKLDGVNENWINNGTSSEIPFTNFKHGNYTLLIKFKNRTTESESEPYIVEIKVTPPWYASKIAFIIYGLLILLSIKPIVDYIIAQNKNKRERMIEKLNHKHREEIYESKLQFFTNIAHEFCTPLTLIYGPCNRIMTYDKSDGLVKKYTKDTPRRHIRTRKEIKKIRKLVKEVGVKTEVARRLDIPYHRVIDYTRDIKVKNKTLFGGKQWTCYRSLWRMAMSISMMEKQPMSIY